MTAASLAGGYGLMATMLTLETTDDGDVVVGLGARWCRQCVGAACQLWRLVEEFPPLRCRVVALFALGNLDFAFALVSFSPWCLGVACGVRRIGLGMRALLGSTVDACSAGGFGRISVFSTLR